MRRTKLSVSHNTVPYSKRICLNIVLLPESPAPNGLFNGVLLIVVDVQHTQQENFNFLGISSVFSSICLINFLGILNS